jgi:hypothetical protein
MRILINFITKVIELGIKTNYKEIKEIRIKKKCMFKNKYYK